MVAAGEGVSALLVEARWAAEPDPPLEAGVWAEAVKVAQANTAAKNRVFIIMTKMK